METEGQSSPSYFNFYRLGKICMYKGSNSRGSSSGRPARQGGTGFSGSSRFGGGRKNSFNGRPINRMKAKGRFGGGSSIHHSQFVRKADPIMESAPYVSKNKLVS